MKKLLDRDKLLRKEELEIEKVDLGKDEYVYVRQMNGRERDKFERTIVDLNEEGTGTERKPEDFRAKLAVCTVCDEKGVLIFKPDDFEVLSQNMSAARLEKIVDVAQRLSKISPEDKEGLVKN